MSLSYSLLAQCPEIAWEDNFDGNALDESKWSFQLGDGCAMGPDLCGWGNNELQWYRKENAVVEDGLLKIIAKREQVSGKSYSSARIRSKEKGDWTYGRFEASIKLPTGKGLWPAFWMLSTDETYGIWPQSGEIDIMELIGQEPDVVHGTIHFGNQVPGNQSSTGSFKLDEGIFKDDFYKFAIEWDENEIRWLIDDFLYLTKTKSDVSPFRWPFDQDFHFLLNVAVGGNWPGSPDASTTFPQTMEVDYVRVYNDYLPYLSGSRNVPFQAKNVSYKVHNVAADATIEWIVPETANIVSGQGTDQLTVDWAETGGALQIRITDACRTDSISLDVRVEPAFAKEFSFENFDDPGRVSLGFSSGTFEDEVANPAPNALNSSNLVGKYTRNASEQFDVLVYGISDLGNVSVFLEGEKKFFLDIYTSEPVGTQILLQLENSNLATPSNFPQGRHSRWEAFTSVQDDWERLEFKLLDQPDASTSNTSINQMIFLFASNTFTGGTYYYDNFDAYSAQETVSTTDLFESEILQLFKLYPNPLKDFGTFENVSDQIISELQILDLYGRVIWQESLRLDPNQIKLLNTETLVKGMYLIRAISEKGHQQSQKVLLE